MNGNDRIPILGTSVSVFNLEQTIELIEDAIKRGEKIRVSMTPVNSILWARKDEKLRDLYNSADIIAADGIPLVWASHFLGKPIKGRVTGLDLLPEFARVAAKNGYSFFFLGAADGVVERVESRLKDHHPELKVAGSFTPPYRKKFSEEESNEMIKRINEVKPDVLWVSLSAPKQDYWIYEHIDKLDVHVAIGVGAAFDVVAGTFARAPQWVQKYGLEWFYRFIQEPRRLFRRYILEAPRFIPLIIAQILKKKIF